ncbi:hypothetical protein B5M09_002086 [Aphanomyces astaci]|uniref:EF-hand domain-containing protein n=1 Tax=Aphanomyces astaci TaxID=112090 RepID=A0A425DFK6_APHAT|nr:hypothetical protein B5M09_002086 [Aphanomyces astaci]
MNTAFLSKRQHAINTQTRTGAAAMSTEPLSEESESVIGLYQKLTGAAKFSVLVTKKVLVRPPFPFLHKLCSEAFGHTNIFTPLQLNLGNLVTRDQKVPRFLVRALAFVTFTLRAVGADCVSVLLFVSPVQVYLRSPYTVHGLSTHHLQALAGLEVDRTHEFLDQLVSVHLLDNADAAKTLAAAEVLRKGENHLYTMAMKFRRGLTKVQAAVRLFLSNKASRGQALTTHDQTPVPGTEFLKLFEGFGTFKGVVRSASNGVYVVYYAQDGDEEELGTQHSNSNPMGLAPPTLPKIAVPGGALKWTKRLKQPKPTDPSSRDSTTNSHLTKPTKKCASMGTRKSSIAAIISPNQRASPPKVKDATSISKLQPDATLFETSYPLSDDRTHQTVVLRAIVKRIDKYLRRKRMRVIDLFRYCDFDQCGHITPGGMEEVLRQMDIRLPPAEMEMFMRHLDTNQNGVIDVDEFESLVRVHRRTAARRDQLRQELPHVLKHDVVGSASLWGLTVPKIPSDVVEAFVNDTCRPLHGLVFVCDIDRILAGPPAKGAGRKDNRFLDHTWLGQFDAQMEKVRGLGG